MEFFREVIERSVAVPALIALLFVAIQAQAGEIEPRSYVNTPVGINFLLAGFNHRGQRSGIRAPRTV
jgi:hypothetical protein